MFRYGIAIILLSIMLTGCGSTKEIQITNNKEQESIPDLFAQPCKISPTPDSATFNEILELTDELRLQLCSCSDRYRRAIAYSFDEHLEPPTKDQCPER